MTTDTLLAGQNNTDAGSDVVAEEAAQGATAPETGEQPQTEGVKPEEGAEAPPEVYEFKAPEGVELDTEVMAEFDGMARELGLSQTKAQTIIDKMTPKIQARQAEAMQAHIAKVRTEWEQAATNDKEYGGAALKENLGVANKVLQAFGTPELTQYLNESGLGNHPELIRLMVRVGRGISEDRLISGRAQQSDQSTGLSYPNSKMK